MIKTSNFTINKYFEENFKDIIEIKRATYAYHLNHRESGAHYFCGSWREAECHWCGRSREFVRHGEESPECKNRPAWADESIESIIEKEEILFDKVFDLARKLAQELDISTLTGKKLSELHHTHGIDTSMLEIALIEINKKLPEYLHDDYHIAYNKHKETGKQGGVKKEIIVAKTKE